MASSQSHDQNTVLNQPAVENQEATSQKRTRRTYPDSCKLIVVHVAAITNNRAAAEKFGICRTTIPAWKQKVTSVEKYCGPVDLNSLSRPLEIVLPLKPCERTPDENLLVFHYIMDLPLEEKSKEKRNRARKGDAVGEDGEVQHFEEFWKADGVGEVFLDELERIPNSVLEAHVSLQLEKKIDPKLAAGAKALVTQSLEYVLTLRSENKAKSTIRAWAPRKRRFLLFWHKINLLNNIEIANATKAAAEQVGDTNEPDVDDAEDADDTASVSSVDREIDTSFDAEAEAEARAVAVLEDGEGDLLQGGVDVLEDNDDDLESGDDAPEEATQPEGSQLPSEAVRAAIAAEINAASPFHMVQATEQNLLTWLRYDVLKL